MYEMSGLNKALTTCNTFINRRRMTCSTCCFRLMSVSSWTAYERHIIPYGIACVGALVERCRDLIQPTEGEVNVTVFGCIIEWSGRGRDAGLMMFARLRHTGRTGHLCSTTPHLRRPRATGARRRPGYLVWALSSDLAGFSRRWAGRRSRRASLGALVDGTRG